MADLLDMRGRTVVVTGASSGIGLETACLLAELGAKGAKDLPEIGPVEVIPRDVTKRA